MKNTGLYGVYKPVFHIFRLSAGQFLYCALFSCCSFSFS